MRTSNDAQFFMNTGPLDQQLGYGSTVFGQLVSGAATIAKITPASVQANGFGELSNPLYPITITSTSLSTTSESGVVLIDTTQAHPGETATITVAANDSVDTTSAQQSFQVTVGPYAVPTPRRRSRRSTSSRARGRHTHKQQRPHHAARAHLVGPAGLNPRKLQARRSACRRPTGKAHSPGADPPRSRSSKWFMTIRPGP